MATTTTTTANAQSFSLFPTTVPKIAVPNPHKRNPSLHRISTVVSPDSVASNAESVMFKMEQEQPPLPRLPAHLGGGHLQQSRTPSPEDIGRAVTTTSPIDGKTPTQPMHSTIAAAKYTPSIYQSPNMGHASPQPPSSFGAGSATTLITHPAAIATGSAAKGKSPIDPSPIVPIRSMFPVFDPTMPVSHQAYVPQRPSAVKMPGTPSFAPATRDNHRSSLSIPFNMQSLAAQRTPASALNFPSDVMSVDIGPRISTQRELERLWEASHGTEPGSAIKSFDLEMARTEEATFVFGSHPSLPFYSLQTYDTNEIAISKTAPSKQYNSMTSSSETPITRDVVLCSLEPMERREPPNDGLVAFIFPKLAALLAINQSAALAKTHDLAPSDRDDIEAQAVRRAAKQEACHLRYNARGAFYELEHPAIGRGAMGGDFATTSPGPQSPTTIRSITGKPVLHVTIATNSPLPTINVIDPNAARRTGANPMTPSTAGPSSAGPGLRRFSSMPQLDSPSPGVASAEFPPLATLDLTSQLLHIDANAILELMPSLFSIDCIVSSILAVAVSDPTVNPAMGGMEIWKARPAPQSRYGYAPSIAGGARSIFRGNELGKSRPGSVRSYAGSTFYATIAEREEAEEEAKLMRRTHAEDVRSAKKSSPLSGSTKKPSRKWFGRSASPSDVEHDDLSDPEKSWSRRSRKKRDKQKKQIVMREFDLEKLGHYQSGERKGEELPAVTRSALSGLVVGLRLIIWFLTMIVQFLAWMLVNVTRGVTSEKF